MKKNKNQNNNGLMEYFAYPVHAEMYRTFMQDLFSNHLTSSFDANPKISKIIVDGDKTTVMKLINSEVAQHFAENIDSATEKFKVDLTVYSKAGDSAQAEIFVPAASKPLT